MNEVRTKQHPWEPMTVSRVGDVAEIIQHGRNKKRSFQYPRPPRRPRRH